MNFSKRIKTLISILVVIVMLSGQLAFADEPAAIQPDMPSEWAAFDIQMASIYKLGGEQSYYNFAQEANGFHLVDAASSLSSAFGVALEIVEKSEKPVTRKEVIGALYNALNNVLTANKKAAAKDDSQEGIVKYFVESGILKGKLNGDYALEDICSKQELLIFAKRAFEHLAYELDMDAKGAFWKVSDDNNTVYLLGSIHVSDGTLFPMSKAIMNAYDESEILAVEANILAGEQDTEYIMQKAFLAGDATIDQLISKEAYEIYAQTMQMVGVPSQVYNKLKPWYAALVLQSVQMAQSSYQGTLGVDIFFLTKAMNVKPIVELEGVKFQIDMFDSFSAELQEQYLLGIIHGEEVNNKVIGDLLELWKKGDMETLEKMMFSEEATSETMKEFNEKLFETRNHNMVDKVELMLVKDDSNDYFVVVGAGHMIGETGIVKQLIEKGYKVERIFK